MNATGQQEVLYSFTGGADGGEPSAGVIADSAGNLYGTTQFGGPANAGVVYKIDATGRETVLYSFTGGADGGQPSAGVIRDSAGNLYGTTTFGGSRGAGVVYKLDAAGHETVLYDFTSGPDGGYPSAGVIRDLKGNLYGTAVGAIANAGVVYKVDPGGHETVLYSFTGGADGGSPQAGVIRDSLGNLYGTTVGGGSSDAGVVYKIDTAGHETVLHSFTGGMDGGFPRGGLVRDLAGNLYGTTPTGGSSGGGHGVVYKVDGAGNVTVLYSFAGGTDGSESTAEMIRDSSGNLYGTTDFGGGPANAGVVFKLDATSHETISYSFPGSPDGSYPQAGVTRDSAGSLYGTTSSGGPANAGAVFKLDATGHETVLYSFTGGPDGGQPLAGVIRDSAGNLYGTTFEFGVAGQGVVYKLDAGGGETVLHNFTGGPDGSQVHSGVIRDVAGNLYGTTQFGGPGGSGVVYKVDAAGNETVLYSFTGGVDGGTPLAGLIRDPAGNLYGTTQFGGAAGFGTVFKLDASNHETVLYSFQGRTVDGFDAGGGLTPDGVGNLYGTTYLGGPSNAGVVYKLEASGHEIVLYSFTGGFDGANPTGNLVRDSAGNLYGTASSGGTANAGVVFKIDPTGHETVLHSFTGAADGGTPYGGVIRDALGNLYGTTANGGAGNVGVVFKITP